MVEESKTEDKPRLQHLKQIEVAAQEQMNAAKLYELDAAEGYENMEFEAKNLTKYMATFPYPYMNGFLHLGKFDYFVVSPQRFNFDVIMIRSRILHVQGRVHDSLPETDRKARSFPLRLPLHWYAYLLSCYPSYARDQHRSHTQQPAY